METKPVNQELLALVTKAQTEGPKMTVLDKTVEDYNEMDNSTVLIDVHIPFGKGEFIYRADRSNTHVPCQATYLSYNVVAYKSKAENDIGNLLRGCSVDVMGYDAERDGDGDPLLDQVPNPQYGVDPEAPEFIETPRLITTDEQGNPLEPKKLMTFRPQFGIDRSKQPWSRPRNIDMLNLVPSTGVPRRDTANTEATATEGEAQPTATGTPGQQRRVEAIAWELMPGMQPKIEKPLLNARLENNEALLEFISHIPKASNAPSLRAAQAGQLRPVVAPQVQASVIQMPKDPFAQAPEKAEEAQIEEPKAEETKVEETKVEEPKAKSKGTK